MGILGSGYASVDSHLGVFEAVWARWWMDVECFCLDPILASKLLCLSSVNPGKYMPTAKVMLPLYHG